MAEPSDRSTLSPSNSSLLLTGEGIIIDIGTGDGSFVYQCARKNPKKFFIGIDANARPLEKISEKIHRNPRKGGLTNALFLKAAVEDLPSELDAIADEVHVHFPWGSLLRGLAMGDAKVLNNLRRVCAPGGLLEVMIGLHPERDKSELQRLGIPPFDIEHIDMFLSSRYGRAGFEVVERGLRPLSDWREMHSSWAKRLTATPDRQVTYLIARAS